MNPPTGASAEAGSGASGPFATTCWSQVLRAARSGEAGAEEALELLCRVYWQPLYRFLRRSGKSPEDAEDLTQGFFAQLLTGTRLSQADPDRGRFRTFLLSSLKNYLVSDWRTHSREKRGGGRRTVSLDCSGEEGSYLREPSDSLSPDRVYERRWAGRLVEEAMARTRAAFGRQDLFVALEGCIQGDPDVAPYAEIGDRFQLSEAAVKVTVHRLRARFRQELVRLVRDTLADPDDEAALRQEFADLALLIGRWT